MSAQPTKKVSLATAWLDGCSGCHMSFLDMDERLIELASSINIVYSPLMDTKIFPDLVDLALVEGSVSSEADLAKIMKIREHTRLLIALGDCAVTGNVPSMRNPFAKCSRFDCPSTLASRIADSSSCPRRCLPARLSAFCRCALTLRRQNCWPVVCRI